MLKQALVLLASLAAATGCRAPAIQSSGPVTDFATAMSHQAVLALVCGANGECLPQCVHRTGCPLSIALSNPAVFHFVEKYSRCDGCDIPTFESAIGIGKCIEYRIGLDGTDFTADFWVSDRCSFRYGSPSESRIEVRGENVRGVVRDVSPSPQMIRDSRYCRTRDDCRCASGSGVEFIGCVNTFHAPLWIAGYDHCGRCVCRDHECVDVGPDHDRPGGGGRNEIHPLPHADARGPF